MQNQKPTIELGPLMEAQLPKMFNWRNSPEIFKWCRQNDFINESHHVNWFERQSLDPKIKMYAIYQNFCDGTSFIGVCGLTDIDLINQRAEFSLYIDPELHGKGLGRQALRALCKHAFESYPLNIIWGESFYDNRAVEMFESLGFQKEGIRRDFYFRSGKMIDAILFSVKRDELK